MASHYFPSSTRSTLGARFRLNDPVTLRNRGPLPAALVPPRPHHRLQLTTRRRHEQRRQGGDHHLPRPGVGSATARQLPRRAPKPIRTNTSLCQRRRHHLPRLRLACGAHPLSRPERPHADLPSLHKARVWGLRLCDVPARSAPSPGTDLRNALHGSYHTGPSGEGHETLPGDTWREGHCLQRRDGSGHTLRGRDGEDCSLLIISDSCCRMRREARKGRRPGNSCKDGELIAFSSDLANDFFLDLAPCALFLVFPRLTFSQDSSAPGLQEG